MSHIITSLTSSSANLTLSASTGPIKLNLSVNPSFNTVTVTAATTSTSTSTGALTVGGNIGLGGDGTSFFGGSMTILTSSYALQVFQTGGGDGIGLVGRTANNGADIVFGTNGLVSYSLGHYYATAHQFYILNAVALTIDSSSNLTSVGSITTAAPNSGTAAAWKLGSLVTSAVVLDTTKYVQLDIGGTLYKLLTAQ